MATPEYHPSSSESDTDEEETTRYQRTIGEREDSMDPQESSQEAFRPERPSPTITTPTSVESSSCRPKNEQPRKYAFKDYIIHDASERTDAEFKDLVNSIKSNNFSCTLCDKTFIGNTNYMKNDKRIRVHAQQHYYAFLCECGYVTRVRDTMATHYNKYFNTGHAVYYKVDRPHWNKGDARRHVRRMPLHFPIMPDLDGQRKENTCTSKKINKRPQQADARLQIENKQKKRSLPISLSIVKTEPKSPRAITKTSPPKPSTKTLSSTTTETNIETSTTVPQKLVLTESEITRLRRQLTEKETMSLYCKTLSTHFDMEILQLKAKLRESQAL